MYKVLFREYSDFHRCSQHRLPGMLALCLLVFLSPVFSEEGTPSFQHISSPASNVVINHSHSLIGGIHRKPTLIEIETDADSFNFQPGFQFKGLGDIKFTRSAAQIGLHEKLLEIRTDSAVGGQLIDSLSRKGGSIVWEAARLHTNGDLVLSNNIFGYMDKKRYQSGLMTFNQNALHYIVIDVTPITQETIYGEKPVELKNVMAHEAIHALFPHRNLLRQYKNGRVLNEVFTMFYTNQIRQQSHLPLRSSYGDSTSQPIDDLIRKALADGTLQPQDLVANLSMRLQELNANLLYDPPSIEHYGVSTRVLYLLAKSGFLDKI